MQNIWMQLTSMEPPDLHEPQHKGTLEELLAPAASRVLENLEIPDYVIFFEGHKRSHDNSNMQHLLVLQQFHH